MFGNKQEVEKLKAELEKVTRDYALLLEKQKAENKEVSFIERVADLEIKMAKLWSLLSEETPRGKTKLTKFGKVAGEKFRQ